MRDWFRRLMMGRYGVDQLTWVLLVLSLILSLCGGIFRSNVLRILCWAVLIVCYLRIFFPQYLRPPTGKPEAPAILVEAEKRQGEPPHP